MRGETVIGPGSPGAGRSLSYSWPPQEFIAATAQPTLSMMYRPNPFSVINQMLNGVGGAPPDPQGAIFYRGVHAYRVTADATSVRVFQPITTAGAPWSAYWPIIKPPADMGTTDAFLCWRFAALLAFDNPPGAVVGDLGLTLCPGLNTTPRLAAEAGIAWGPVNTGAIGLTVVQADGGARTFDQACASNPDIANWHLYELRALGATHNREATLQACIDGQVKFSLPWGAGTVLPGLQSGAAGINLGYRWSLSNRGGSPFTTAVYVASSGIQVSAAPTLGDLF